MCLIIPPSVRSDGGNVVSSCSASRPSVFIRRVSRCHWSIASRVVRSSAARGTLVRWVVTKGTLARRWWVEHPGYVVARGDAVRRPGRVGEHGEVRVLAEHGGAELLVPPGLRLPIAGVDVEMSGDPWPVVAHPLQQQPDRLVGGPGQGPELLEVRRVQSAPARSGRARTRTPARRRARRCRGRPGRRWTSARPARSPAAGAGSTGRTPRSSPARRATGAPRTADPAGARRGGPRPGRRRSAAPAGRRHPPAAPASRTRPARLGSVTPSSRSRPPRTSPRRRTPRAGGR